jgi:hypothetical protein
MERFNDGNDERELLWIEGVPRAILEEIGRKRHMTIELQVFEAINRYLIKHRK